jgi:hypothetical protein
MGRAKISVSISSLSRFFSFFFFFKFCTLCCNNCKIDGLKVNILFGRNDLYFYNVTQTYAGVDGVSNLASVFSLDRFVFTLPPSTVKRESKK